MLRPALHLPWPAHLHATCRRPQAVAVARALSHEAVLGGRNKALLAGAVEGVGPGHDLLAHADLVDRAFPHRHLLPEHEPLLRWLSLDFERKYPDGPIDEPGTRRSLPSLDRLDKLLIPLLAHYPLDSALRHRTGLYSVYHLLTDPSRAKFYWANSHWIAHQNSELQRHMPLLAANYAEGERLDRLPRESARTETAE